MSKLIIILILLPLLLLNLFTLYLVPITHSPTTDIDAESDYLLAYNYIIKLAPGLSDTICKIKKTDLIDFYNDINSADVAWGYIDKNTAYEYAIIESYVPKIFNNTNGYTYHENAKRLIRYLEDKDNLFRKLILYYNPIKNIDIIDDIDKDGLAFKYDEYPLNYNNGRVYLLSTTRDEVEYPSGIGATYAHEEIEFFLMNELNYPDSDLYTLDSTSIKEFESTLQAILSKATENDIIVYIGKNHGTPDGKITFYNDHKETEQYPVSRLNSIFQDKNYAVAIIFLGNCYGQTYKNLLDIDRSIIFTESEGPSYGRAIYVIRDQLIKNKNLNYHNFIDNYRNDLLRFNMDLEMWITGEPDLLDEQDTRLLIPAYYKK